MAFGFSQLVFCCINLTMVTCWCWQRCWLWVESREFKLSLSFMLFNDTWSHQGHSVSWPSSFLCLQITDSNLRSQVKWAVRDETADGHFNLPHIFVWICMGEHTHSIIPPTPFPSKGWIPLLSLKVLNFWKLTSYCSLKPLWSGMGEVVPARTSPTLHPPSPPTVHQLSRLVL